MRLDRQTREEMEFAQAIYEARTRRRALPPDVAAAPRSPPRGSRASAELGAEPAVPKSRRLSWKALLLIVSLLTSAVCGGTPMLVEAYQERARLNSFLADASRIEEVLTVEVTGLAVPFTRNGKLPSSWQIYLAIDNSTEWDIRKGETAEVMLADGTRVEVPTTDWRGAHGSYITSEELTDVDNPPVSVCVPVYLLYYTDEQKHSPFCQPPHDARGAVICATPTGKLY